MKKNIPIKRMAPSPKKTTSNLKAVPFQNMATSNLKEISEGSVQINSRLEDGATVVSANFSLQNSREKLETLLSRELKDLAARVYENNGIIGHIKASTEIKSMQMYSITDTILHVKNGEKDSIVVTFAFILYLIEPETAEEWTRQIIQRILDESLKPC